MDKPEKRVWTIPWKGIVVAFVASVAVLIWIFLRVSKPADVLYELGQYPVSYFLLALFFVLLAWVVDGQRIGTLTRAAGHSVPWWNLTIILGAANFLTLVTPFAGGGGALIVYYLYRRGVSPPTATGIVVAGGLAGQISLALLGFVTSSSLRNVPSDLVQSFQAVKIGAAIYLVFLLALMTVLIKSERFFRWLFRKRGATSRSATWIEEFRVTVEFLFKKRWRYFLATIGVAILYYSVYYMGTFVLLSGFDVFQPQLRFAASVLFGMAPVFSPIPGGAGLSEGVSWFVLDSVLEPDLLSTFIILWRTVVFYIPILLGGTIFVSFAVRWASQVILPEKQDHNR